MLRRVVCPAIPSIVEEACERLPTFRHVIHGLRHADVTREVGAFNAHPLLKRGDQRSDPDLACRTPLPRGQTVDLALDIEDRIDPAHRPNRQRRIKVILVSGTGLPQGGIRRMDTLDARDASSIDGDRHRFGSRQSWRRRQHGSPVSCPATFPSDALR